MPRFWVDTYGGSTHRGIEWNPHNSILIVHTGIHKSIVNILPLTRSVLVLRGKCGDPLPNPTQLRIVSITTPLKSDTGHLGRGIHLHFIPLNLWIATILNVPSSSAVQSTLFRVPVGVVVIVPPRRRRALPSWNIEEFEFGFLKC